MKLLLVLSLTDDADLGLKRGDKNNNNKKGLTVNLNSCETFRSSVVRNSLACSIIRSLWQNVPQKVLGIAGPGDGWRENGPGRCFSEHVCAGRVASACLTAFISYKENYS